MLVRPLRNLYNHARFFLEERNVERFDAIIIALVRRVCSVLRWQVRQDAGFADR